MLRLVEKFRNLAFICASNKLDELVVEVDLSERLEDPTSFEISERFRELEEVMLTD